MNKTTAVLLALLPCYGLQADVIPTYHLTETPGGLVTDIPGAVIETLGPEHWSVTPPDGTEWQGGPSVLRITEHGGVTIDRLNLPFPAGTRVSQDVGGWVDPDNGIPTTLNLFWLSDLIRGPGDFEDGVTEQHLDLIPVGHLGTGEVWAHVIATDGGAPPSWPVSDHGPAGLMMAAALACVVGAFKVSK